VRRCRQAKQDAGKADWSGSTSPKREPQGQETADGYASGKEFGVCVNHTKSWQSLVRPAIAERTGAANEALRLLPAALTCEDGDHGIVASQAIAFTDFSLPEIMLWLQNDVTFLPSEY
jgi:hypothetical protein